MPFPPWPVIPVPSTWIKGQFLNAAQLRSDVANALLMLTQPPVFTGTQTGLPAVFTTAPGVNYPVIDAPGTAYVLNQPVVFTAVAGSMSGFPPGLTAGQVYYAYNPAGQIFGISTIPGASSPYTGFGTASGGLVTATQLITQSAWTPVSLDTEPGAGDPWGGHQVSANQPYYYGMLPGIYLADFTFPANSASGGGGVSAGLLTQEGTGPVQTVGGQCGPLSSSANRYTSVSVTRLVQFPVTGIYGAPGNNYAGAAAWQDSPGVITPLTTAGATRFPQMNLEWVAGLTAGPALQVPDNDTWPAPPQQAGRTFLNKNVRDTIAFLAGRPVMEAYMSSASFTVTPTSSPPGTVGGAISLDTAQADPWGAFTASGGVWRAPVPGRYDIYAQFPVRAAAGSLAVAAGFTLISANYNGGLAVTMWGAQQQALTASSEINCAVARRQVRLNAGDQVFLSGYLNGTGGPLAVPGAGATWQARLITIWRGK